MSDSIQADVRCGLVHCESWAGHSAHKVTILRETKTRYVCRWEDIPAFRHATGDIIRPPKHAVEITPNRGICLK
jgi:hypothetical protein